MNNIDVNGIGMFYQDDYEANGLHQEYSRNNFVIYSRGEFESVSSTARYSSYLAELEKVYVNPYTGELVFN